MPRPRAAARREAMQPVERPFDIVVTTNSGYPLDQNLYQAVKGMSAAPPWSRPGGTIVCAAECRDGLPDHGSYAALLARRRTRRQALLARIAASPDTMPDQWQVQVQARVQIEGRVLLRCDGLTDAEVRAAHLEPIADIGEAVERLLARRTRDARMCVLPQGPQTIAYVCLIPGHGPRAGDGQALAPALPLPRGRARRPRGRPASSGRARGGDVGRRPRSRPAASEEGWPRRRPSFGIQVIADDPAPQATSRRAGPSPACSKSRSAPISPSAPMMTLIGRSRRSRRASPERGPRPSVCPSMALEWIGVELDAPKAFAEPAHPLRQVAGSVGVSEPRRSGLAFDPGGQQPGARGVSTTVGIGTDSSVGRPAMIRATIWRRRRLARVPQNGRAATDRRPPGTVDVWRASSPNRARLGRPEPRNPAFGDVVELRRARRFE